MKKITDAPEEYDIHTDETGGAYTIKKSRGWDLFGKIFSVAAAFAIWFYVMSVDSPTFERTFSALPVAIQNVDETGLSVYSGDSVTVDVTVTGRKAEINNMSLADISAYVDVMGITTAGRYTLDVNFTLPGGVQISEQSVKTLSVYLDNRSSISVPVEISMSDFIIPESCELGTPVPEYEQIVVTGPASVLDTISKAKVSVSPGKLSSSVVVNGRVTLVNAGGELITNTYVKYNTSDMRVEIPVYSYKTVPLEVSYKYGFFNSDNTRITVSPSTIRLKGDAETLEKISSINLTTLDEKAIGEDMRLTVFLTLPENVVSADNISKAEVTVNHIGTELVDMSVTNIAINNPNNLKYELLSSAIRVKLRGMMHYLERMDSSNIEAIVNLDNIKNVSGTVAVPVEIRINSIYQYYVYEIGTYQIMVKFG